MFRSASQSYCVRDTGGFPFAKDELDNSSLGSAGFDCHTLLSSPLVKGGLEVVRIACEVLAMNGPPDRSVHPLLPRVKSTPTRSVGVYALSHMCTLSGLVVRPL
jgi:hypothetical protein